MIGAVVRPVWLPPQRHECVPPVDRGIAANDRRVVVDVAEEQRRQVWSNGGDHQRNDDPTLDGRDVRRTAYRGRGWVDAIWLCRRGDSGGAAHGKRRVATTS